MNRITVLCAAAIATAFVSSSATAQERAPRPPAEKQSREALRALPAANRVTVKFRDGLTVRGGPQGLTGLEDGRRAALEKALKAAGVEDPKIRRLHKRPEAELDAERAEGEAESGKSLADLNLYFIVTLPQGVNAADVADSLNGLDFVEYATPAAQPAPPPVDIAPKTPKFTSQQGYRKSGSGVGALSADRYPGADGAGMRIVDVEYGWTLDHEDLGVPVGRVTPALSDIDNPFGDDHGTAVLGIVSGQDNRYGVTGLAPAATLWLVAVNTFSGGYDPANAISIAAGKLRRGDVMVIEQQYPACGAADYGPLEAYQPAYDAIETATARGIVVIAAAGNGALDLDAKACNGAFKRKRRDSGAIIVGAGASGGRQRLGFSTFGSRVDVQGWGENVTTTAYGDLFLGGGDVRQSYTATFSGTSSATPVVAGAVLQIQGVIRACGLKPLKGPAMRDLIVRTGAPQRGGNGKIGPLPRILPALQDSVAKDCVASAGARRSS